MYIAKLKINVLKKKVEPRFEPGATMCEARTLSIVLRPPPLMIRLRQYKHKLCSVQRYSTVYVPGKMIFPFVKSSVIFSCLALGSQSGITFIAL